MFGGDPLDEACGFGFFEIHLHYLVDLFDELHHGLVVGWYFLSAGVVVDLCAVVIGRVVRSADVEPALRAEMAYQERELRGGEHDFFVFGESPDLDAVGCVNARGKAGKISRSQAQHGIGNVCVVQALAVIKLPHVKGHYHGQVLPAFFFFLMLQVFHVPLNRSGEGRGIKPVRADADRAALAPGAKGQILIKAVNEKAPFFTLDQIFELRPVGGESFVFEPFAQIGNGGFFYGVREVQRVDGIEGHG